MDEENLDVVDEELDNEESLNEGFINDDITDDSDDTTEENSEEEVSQADKEKEDEAKLELQRQKEEQEKINNIVEKRLLRERRRNEKENAQYKQIAKIIQNQTGAKSLEETIGYLNDFYNIKESDNLASQYNEREEKILAEADAQEFKELGLQEMIVEANRISAIPKENRTARENFLFQSLAESITAEQEKFELQKVGGREEVYNSQAFKDFRKQFTFNTPVAKIYEIFNRLNPGKETVVPASPGSASSKTTKQKYKDFYTPEEVNKFTERDLDDPKLMEIVENSMSKWKY